MTDDVDELASLIWQGAACDALGALQAAQRIIAAGWLSPTSVHRQAIDEAVASVRAVLAAHSPAPQPVSDAEVEAAADRLRNSRVTLNREDADYLARAALEAAAKVRGGR